MARRNGMSNSFENAQERALRDAVIAGDEAAWRVLYEQHFSPLYGHITFRVGGRRDRAEEVAQECWAIAVRRIRRFDPKAGTFGAWLHGIAENVLKNKHRRWRRRDGAEAPLREEQAAPAVASPDTTAALAEHVATALGMLPECYQEMIRAKYRDGKTVAEIAEERNQTAKAVESMLSRARAAFRKEYRRLDEAT